MYTPACTGAAVAWPSGKETLFWLWPPGHAWGQRGREWTGQTKCDCTGRHREQETVVHTGNKRPWYDEEQQQRDGLSGAKRDTLG